MNLNQVNIVVIDVETSGPSIFENDLMSLYMRALHGETSIELYVKYDHELKWGSIGKRYFNRYRKLWEQNAVGAAEAIEAINQYLESEDSESIVLAGHNVAFDSYFLKKLETYSDVRLSKKLSHRLIDTHSILTMNVLQGRLPQYALKLQGAAKYFGIATDQPHFAKHDALLAREILLKLIDCGLKKE